jgi:hypothetical protein
VGLLYTRLNRFVKQVVSIIVLQSNAASVQIVQMVLNRLVILKIPTSSKLCFTLELATLPLILSSGQIA